MLSSSSSSDPTSFGLGFTFGEGFEAGGFEAEDLEAGGLEAGGLEVEGSGSVSSRSESIVS
jgi:hypothetical protein